jgi:hypothetical protein
LPVTLLVLANRCQAGTALVLALKSISKKIIFISVFIVFKGFVISIPSRNAGFHLHLQTKG